MPSTLRSASGPHGLTLVYITFASILFLGIVVALSLAAQQLLFCLHILRRTRYHDVHLIERSIYGITYHARDGDTGIICSVGQLRVSLRLPTLSNLHFCKIEFYDVRYYGPWASGCCAALTANLRFPRLDKSWCTARIDDLRLTVRSSEHIPDVIARLRENLLRTIVLGDVQKLEHFASAADTRLLWSGEGLGVVAEARGYQVTIYGRMYEFGRLKGSLMRNWDTEEGRFLLEGENIQWYKVDLDSSKVKTSRKFSHIIHYPATVFSSLVSASLNPASLLDLEVIRGEIKFRKFRDRDHTLGKHALQFLGEWKPERMNASFVHKFMWDTVHQLLAGATRTRSKN